MYTKARILLVDLRAVFQSVEWTKNKKNKKALKMTSSLVIFIFFSVIFRAFFFVIFRAFFFLISPEKTVNLVRQTNTEQSVLNFQIFLKIWTGQSLFTVPLSKIHR